MRPVPANMPTAPVLRPDTDRTMIRYLAASLTAIAAVIAATGSPATAQQPEFSMIYLQAHSATGTSDAILTCHPPGGTHPQAVSACAAIAVVEADLSLLPGDPTRTCTDEYAPVTVTAMGVWQDQRVTYANTYGNWCLAQRDTYPVFALAEPAA